MSFTPSPAYQLVLDRLLAAREEGSMTVEELAQSLHLTVSQVEAFETGRVRLDFAQTKAWCHALGLDFTTFVLQVAQDIDALPAQSHPLGSDDTEGNTSNIQEGETP